MTVVEDGTVEAFSGSLNVTTSVSSESGASTTLAFAAAYPDLLRAAILEDGGIRMPGYEPTNRGAPGGALRYKEMTREQLIAHARQANPTWAEAELGPWADAKQRVKDAIHIDVCQRIGGDHQQIHVLNTRLDALTFKHLLLPVWMLAYRFHDKPYRVFINAGTGEVQGERPYSFVKIAFAVLGIAAVALTAAFLMSRN